MPIFLHSMLKETNFILNKSFYLEAILNYSPSIEKEEAVFIRQLQNKLLSTSFCTYIKGDRLINQSTIQCLCGFTTSTTM